MKRVFDASAVLAAIFMEQGGEVVASLWLEGENYISAVNYAEVITKLNERGMSDEEISTVMEGVALEVINFDETAAQTAGLMRKQTKALGLSLGDRACLAIGLIEDAQIVTAERIWKKLKGFNFNFIR
jgi:ribonuclease VapC